MHLASGTLIEYQQHRLYILSMIKHRFKEYLVCLDFTGTIKANTGNIAIAILKQSSSTEFSPVEKVGLFDTIYQKNVDALHKNAKFVLNIFGDACGNRPELTEQERILLSQYLELIMENNDR